MSKHKNISIPLHLTMGSSQSFSSRNKLLENKETQDQELKAWVEVLASQMTLALKQSQFLCQ